MAALRRSVTSTAIPRGRHLDAPVTAHQVNRARRQGMPLRAGRIAGIWATPARRALGHRIWPHAGGSVSRWSRPPGRALGRPAAVARALGLAFPGVRAGLHRSDEPLKAVGVTVPKRLNACEIETAMRCRVPVVALVLNNNCWGSEKAYQKYFFDGRYVGADLTNPRFDKFAELFGGQGFYAERPGDIGSAVAAALNADVPSIIEIPVDPDELTQPARGDAVKATRR